MNRPRDSQKPTKRDSKDAVTSAQKGSWGPRILYLIFYNLTSAVLWSIVLGRVIRIDYEDGYQRAYSGVGDFVRWVQTLAGFEILHAAIGLVRAPLFTTLMQVASRFLLVWGVAYFFPQTVAPSPFYSSMLVAWSVTEVIRYSYFAVNLAYGRVPAWLTWLRYNTFLVLYPMGISSECWLVWKAMGPAKAWNPLLEWALVAVLLIYIPGSYVLFSHMMAQRRKVLRAAGSKAGS